MIGDPDVPSLQQNSCLRRKNCWYVWEQISQVAIPLQRGDARCHHLRQDWPSEACMGHGVLQFLMVVCVGFGESFGSDGSPKGAPCDAMQFASVDFSGALERA